MNKKKLFTINLIGSSNMIIEECEEKIFSHVKEIIVESISLPVYVYETEDVNVTIKCNSKSYRLSAEKYNTIKEKDGVVLIKQNKTSSFCHW